uniref:Uncharacterized protein n=1 Tax=Picea sitchensis TaxID=3332 RepID=D5A807_PICSI|nr:unknown [Picea sitchensis]
MPWKIKCDYSYCLCMPVKATISANFFWDVWRTLLLYRSW